MYQNMKYIIFDDHGKVVPVLFSYYLTHSDVADNLKGTIGRYAEIVSAGFVRLSDNGEIECFHESISLDVESRGKKDAEIIKKLL